MLVTGDSEQLSDGTGVTAFRYTHTGAHQKNPGTMNVTEVTDDELLLEMSYAAQNPNAANAALTIFYQRFKDDLLGFSTTYCRGTSLDAEQFMLNAFKEAYERAGSFNCASKDPEIIRKLVKAWLFAILKHRVIDAIRATQRERNHLRDLTDDERIEDHAALSENLNEEESKARPEVVERANQILGELSPREQDILGLSFEYRNRETGHFEIPDYLLENLAKSLGVLPSSIKTLRHRIISRIQQKGL